jgi:heme-degrading monooxygenase HmoA
MELRAGVIKMMIQKPDKWGYVVIWEFRVRPGMEKRFEEIYGPEGDWARLFRQDKEFMGTELIRNLKGRESYLTLDFWTSEKGYKSFRARHASEYEVMDASCEALTESEREVGSYARAGALLFGT